MPTSTLQRIGNYVIDRQIGKGGMSEVWLAHHRSLADRQVAVKVLLSQDEEWIGRFDHEADLISRLRHENIVQIYDHGFQPPYHYSIMEFVPGGALRSVLQTKKTLSLDLALHVFRGAGAALDYAHAHGVIHRDVTPGNILIEQNTGRVLLTDFGIAREAGKPGVTTVNNVLGTPGYLSPEHIQSTAAVTHLSDLYSLGVVLYEMIAGKLPWNYNPGIADASGGPFAPPRSLQEVGVTGLPSDFDRVLQTLLSIDPTKRYPSAQAAVQDIDRALSRHTSDTQVVGSGSQSTVAAPPATATAEPHPVEVALRVDLRKAPMQEARQHAASLTPAVIQELLNTWSVRSRFRRQLLGRQAHIHRITHHNLYFYTLHMLYEKREPIKTVEEPDHAAAPVPMERELDRWSVELPPPKSVADHSDGIVRLPGSTRVTACGECNGLGKRQCPRCKGQGRVKRSASTAAAVTTNAPKDGTPAPDGPSGGAAAAVAGPKAMALVPCPECSGAGGIRCERCDGVGRLLERKTTTWRRWPASFNGHDDLPNLDEQWVRKHCAMKEIYREQQLRGVRPEWLHVPELKAMIEQAQAKSDADTRVALAEAQVMVVPVTEIIFDLDDQHKLMPAADPDDPDAVVSQPMLYNWYIYGFENVLPMDWRFLNWDRVLVWLGVVVIVALVLLLLFSLLVR